MKSEELTLTADITIEMENDDVYFVGRATSNKYVSDVELEDMNKWFINQPVIYRHDHPSKKKGGSVYGRVVESEIIEEDGTKVLKFKSLMKQKFKKHKDLIQLAKDQEKLGKPIRYSVGYVSEQENNVPTGAEIYEVSVTNNPVCKECGNVEIMEMEEDMPKNENETENHKELDEKDIIIAEMQEKFEKSIDFQKELEKKEEEVNSLNEKVKEYEKMLTESKELFKSQDARIQELEVKADLAERVPIVEKIFTLERNPLMKEKYMDSARWPIEDLNKQLEEVIKLNKDKIQAQRAVTRTLESSRHMLMSEDDKTLEKKLYENMSPELKKIFGDK